MTSTSSFTEAIVAEFARFSEQALHANAAQTVKNAFVDTIACVRGASQHLYDSQVAQAVLGDVSPQKTSPFRLLQPSVLPPTQQSAVMLYATAAHYDDYDDFAFAAHPSCVLVPIIISECERTEDYSRVVEAYAFGYQVWGMLSRHLPKPMHDLGWHQTCIIGSIAGAAALVTQRGGTADTLRSALGFASTFSGGLLASFGTSAKPIQVGAAAERSVLSANLAHVGLTAASDGCDALLAAIYGKRVFAAEAPPVYIDDFPPRMKKYAACYATHRIIDALIEMNLIGRAAEIEKIEVEVSETARKVAGVDAPENAAQARFSIPFVAALAIQNGQVRQADFCPTTLADPNLLALMRKVAISITTQACPEEPALAFMDRVKIQFSSGQIIDESVRFVRGHKSHPLRPDDLKNKILDCVGVDGLEAVSREAERFLTQQDTAFATSA